MSLKLGITGYTGSLGKEIIKNNSIYSLSYFKGDIRKKNDIFNWLNNNQLDAIIHLAAIVPIKVVNGNKKKAYDVNYNGTKNLINVVKNFNLKWFFFASTSHVYSSQKNKITEKTLIKPISYYGKTKYLSEKYLIKKLKETEINYCIGRIFSTTNKNQKKNYLIPDLKKKIKSAKKKIILNNLNHYRDFISMKDISKIIFFLAKKKYQGIINIGSGKKVYLKDIARIISNKFNKKIEFIDNHKKTYLVSNNNKLNKIYKTKLNKNLEKMIF